MSKSAIVISVITLCFIQSVPLNAQQTTHIAAYTVHGERLDDGFGESVSGVGDVNGDGYNDLVVGAPNSASLSGAATVYSGIDGQVLYSYQGDNLVDFFGSDASGAGDVNGDGFADFIIGAPVNTNGTRPGYARVFSGVDGSTLHTYYGPNTRDYFGMSVNVAGDINNDGFSDVYIQAEGQGFSRRGTAFVYSGVDGSLLLSLDHINSKFGGTMSSIGDMNGDGITDLFLGSAKSGSGDIFVYSGADGSLLHTRDGFISGPIGLTVDYIDDVNGDGIGDLLTTGNDFSRGRVEIYSGSDFSQLQTFYGPEDVYFGGSSAGLGDVNGDGYGDYIISAYADDSEGTNAGAAFIYSGLDGSVLSSFYGNADRDFFGNDVSSLGDVNNDGIDDFVVSGRGDGMGFATVYLSITAVPEPSSVLIISLLALGCAASRRRRP